MATPRASTADHRDFWAGVERPESGILLIANLAANLRATVAPEPNPTDGEYDSRAKSCELWVGSFIGQRGVITSAGAGGATVAFAEQTEALRMARELMGTFAASSRRPAPITAPPRRQTAYYGLDPFGRF